MELEHLRGIGPKRLNSLRAADIYTLRDLFYFFPVRYEDHDTLFPCAVFRNDPVMVEGKIVRPPVLQRWQGNIRVSMQIQDNSGCLQVQWFRSPWIIQALQNHHVVRLYGKMTIHQGRCFLNNPKIITAPGLVPIYRAIEGIPQQTFRKLISEAMSCLPEICPSFLPEEVLQSLGLCSREEAFRVIHQPDTIEHVQIGRRSIQFEQMLLYLAHISARENRRKPAIPFRLTPEWNDIYWNSLPFKPTCAQKSVLVEIASDLTRNQAMARLVQGDVGCGKTAIAFGAVYLAYRAGYQSAMMAPTEILAVQHYENAMRILSPLGVHCRLLTGSTTAKERKITLTELESGARDAVFGTHALLSDPVNFAKLGLAITDEQHRFGVNQRSRLQQKGNACKMLNPHVLVMSATPIPRSLALILYGDLDLSVVSELPPGRKPVQTRIVPLSRRDDLYRFVREQIHLGHQAYIVCPLVEGGEENETEWAEQDAHSAKAVYEELKTNQLSGCSLGLTWGAQKSEEKETVLSAFKGGKYDALIATTVIEVGVDNPNASVIVIEDAHRFGLSQLHQLRGRVGRGSVESWCFLLSDRADKLDILRQTNDGFLVSQKDLELRGPGDLMGTRQSGISMDGLLLDGDMRLLDQAAQYVKALHQSSPEPLILKRLEEEAAKIFVHREIGVN